jgi:hypothetical protein
VTEYRASLDAVVRFSNGGDLSARGFRVDLPSADAGQDEIAALFMASRGWSPIPACPVPRSRPT